MTGRGRRIKGKVGEYLVRDILRRMMYVDAVRVPLSGASEGFKGDVLFTDDREVKRTIEVKSRKASFTSLYTKYNNTTRIHDRLGLITITALEPSLRSRLTRLVEPESYKMFHRRFETLFKLKQESDYLVVKDNNKPPLLVLFHGQLPLQDFMS